MHREQQIINAFVAALQASTLLAIPAANVFANRSLSLAEDQGEMPAATVNEAEDVQTSDLGTDNLAFIDSLLGVEVQHFATGTSDAEVRTALSDQRRYIHVALMADDTLGLSFVIGLRYGGADRAEIDSNGALIVGSRISRWAVHYRMNKTDPGD